MSTNLLVSLLIVLQLLLQASQLQAQSLCSLALCDACKHHCSSGVKADMKLSPRKRSESVLTVTLWPHSSLKCRQPSITRTAARNSTGGGVTTTPDQEQLVPPRFRTAVPGCGCQLAYQCSLSAARRQRSAGLPEFVAFVSSACKACTCWAVASRRAVASCCSSSFAFACDTAATGALSQCM